MKTIMTKYHGPTNTRGSRISASDGDTTVSIPYPHELSGNAVHIAALRAFCEKLNWTGTLIGGYTKTGMVFIFQSVLGYAAPVVRVERVKIVSKGKMPVEGMRATLTKTK
jgi:hypothetical protein